MLYAVPVAAYRVHEWLWPLAEGPSRIDAPGYSPWWGGHQCQVMYSAFPALEAALRLVPGLYSAWLRLWGGRVGRGVYWTPLVEITDRALIEVGDGVVFGHRVACYAHLVKPRSDGLVLYVRRIRIGDGVLLGAGSRLGPGRARRRRRGAADTDRRRRRPPDPQGGLTRARCRRGSGIARLLRAARAALRPRARGRRRRAAGNTRAHRARLRVHRLRPRARSRGRRQPRRLPRERRRSSTTPRSSHGSKPSAAAKPPHWRPDERAVTSRLRAARAL